MRVTNTKKAGCFYGRLSGIPPPHPAQALAQDFAVAGLLVLLILLSAVGLLWEASPPGAEPCRRAGPDHLPAGAAEQRVEHHQLHARAAADRADHLCRVHRHGFPAGRAGPHHRRGPRLFCQRLFSGRQPDAGMQIYSSGLPEALSAPTGAGRRGPSVVVNSTTCKRSDGGTEVPMEVLTARQPPVLYYPAGGTNVLNRDGLFQLPHLLPAHAGYDLPTRPCAWSGKHADLRVQSITPVRPEAHTATLKAEYAQPRHPGLYKERLCEINNELAAIALEKNCAFRESA